jgi:hypothetical protein
MSAEQAQRIEVTGESGSPDPVEVHHRGLGAKVLDAIGAVPETDGQPRVLRTGQAQAAEDIARGLTPAEPRDIGVHGQARADSLISKHDIKTKSGERYH